MTRAEMTAAVAEQLFAFRHRLFAAVTGGVSDEIVIDGVAIALDFASADRPDHPMRVLWRAISPDRMEILFFATLRGSGAETSLVIRLSQLLPLLLAYHHAFPFAGEQIVSLEDHDDTACLTFCGDARPGKWLIPDIEFLGNGAYRDIAERYADAGPAWEQRSPAAFWRGSTTGLWHAAPSWREMPRLRLCEIAGQRPDLFDVGISSVVQIELHAAEIEQLGYMRPPVPAERWVDWRYQIDVDGNSNAWAGFFQRLLTGSPVLKVASPLGFRQWFYDRMVPWRHYVPVEADMGDLVEKIEWLRAHDSVGRLIGEEGRRFALSLDYEGELRFGVLTIATAMADGAFPMPAASSG